MNSFATMDFETVNNERTSVCYYGLAILITLPQQF
jgi:hypothetical protein